MNKIEYDLETLMKFEAFDAKKAVSKFRDNQAYFDKLTEFNESWHDYLYLYNPTVVIYGDDVRRDFLSDMEKIRKLVRMLELTIVLAELDNLDDTLKNNDAKGLSDGLKVFYATLKIVSSHIAEARLSAPVSGESVSQAGGTPLILSVDDKPELLTAITSVLRSQYKVISVTSGKAALKAIEAHTPALFLLDIEMPEMDGYELAAKIREQSRFLNTPIIFLTSKSTKEHVLNAMAHGGKDYLIKPVDSSILLGKIQHHLGEVKT